MDILSWNTGYFLGYEGTIPDYLRNPLKGVLGTRREAPALTRAAAVIDGVDPDLVLLQEIDTGSRRTGTRGQAAYLAEHVETMFEAHAAGKYGNPGLRRLPLLGHMANGVLHRGATVTDGYLDAGIKSLVQRVDLDGVSIFNVHLARFGARVRRRQLAELCRRVEAHDPAIIIGDVNAMHGLSELDPVRERLGWRVTTDGATFPATHPRHVIDCALHPPSLAVTCRRLPHTVSDHRPLLVSVE